jgi:predicted patatin/cPLA2 family phospholipase
MFDTIYFNGGCIRGIGYIGFLYYLEKNDLIKNIKTMRGTSMGALIIAFYLIGYDSKSMIQKLIEIDLTEIVDIEFSKVLNRSSLLEGKGMEKILKKFIKCKNCKDITFSQLYEKTGIHFTVTGSDIVNYKSVNFNHETFPDMKLVTALRITSAIPFVFPPIKYKDGLFTDGCLFDMFNQDYDNDNLLYVCLNDRKEAVEENTPLHKFGPMIIGGIFKYLSDTMMNKCKNSIELQIDDEIDNFDFGASSDILISLFNQGYESSLNFFEKNKQLFISMTED